MTPTPSTILDAPLERLSAMETAFDEAAEALMRRDTQAFDLAMSRFREIAPLTGEEMGCG